MPYAIAAMAELWDRMVSPLVSGAATEIACSAVSR